MARGTKRVAGGALAAFLVAAALWRTPASGQPVGAAAPAAGRWEYRVGALQYAEEGGVKDVFFVALPVGGAEIQIRKLSDMAAEGWEYVGPANMYDVMVFDNEKLMHATVLRQAR